MIIVFEYGRLGNQLFQYVGLRKLFPDHNLVCFGFKELKQALDSVDATIVESEAVHPRLLTGLSLILGVLAKFRIIGTIQESFGEGKFDVAKSTGLFFGLYLFRESFLQHAALIDTCNPKLSLNKYNCLKALGWIGMNTPGLAEQNIVFVHVRRGDYLTWPTREFPAVLNMSWYIKAMDQMRAYVKDPIFLVLTDDCHYAKDCFGDLSDVIISENNQLVDLALMSLCRHGILSASTFAWWGGWFSNCQYCGEGIYMAPRYWCGHRKKEWFPEGFTTSWITYID